MLSFRIITSTGWHTPLKIYNGAPIGRSIRYSRDTLPINELKDNPPEVVCPVSNLYLCRCNIDYFDTSRDPASIDEIQSDTMA